MKERPILFSGPMVRALLAGTKTQTRRIVKPQPHPNHIISPAWGKSPDGFPFGEPGLWRENGPDYPDGPEDERRCPYGVIGDRLWVKETWNTPPGHYELASPRELRVGTPIRYASDGEVRGDSDRFVDTAGCIAFGRARPSIFMPRWASRITLELVDVRVERLHAITPDDVLAEGLVDPKVEVILGSRVHDPGALLAAFKALWVSINGEASWHANPFVWVLSFRRVTYG